MSDKIKYNYSGNRQGMWDREAWRQRKKQAAEKQYTRPAYGHMVRDYMDNQKRVILDKTQWLWLNFTEKKSKIWQNVR